MGWIGTAEKNNTSARINGWEQLFAAGVPPEWRIPQTFIELVTGELLDVQCLSPVV